MLSKQIWNYFTFSGNFLSLFMLFLHAQERRHSFFGLLPNFSPQLSKIPFDLIVNMFFISLRSLRTCKESLSVEHCSKLIVLRSVICKTFFWYVGYILVLSMKWKSLLHKVNTSSSSWKLRLLLEGHEISRLFSADRYMRWINKGTSEWVHFESCASKCSKNALPGPVS